MGDRRAEWVTCIWLIGLRGKERGGVKGKLCSIMPLYRWLFFVSRIFKLFFPTTTTNNKRKNDKQCRVIGKTKRKVCAQK